MPLSEVFGVLLIFLALFLLLSLVGYDGRDPTLAAQPSPGEPVHNFAGRVGATLAHGLLQMFGFLAFLLPFFLGYAGILSFRSGGRRHLLARIASIAILVLILAALLAFLFGVVSFRHGLVPAGGLLGEFLSLLLARYLGQAGSLVLLFAALIVFVFLVLGLSFTLIGRFFVGLFHLATRKFRIIITEPKPKERTEAGASSDRAPVPHLKEDEGGAEPAAKPEAKPAKPAKTAPLIIRKTAPLPRQLDLPQMEKKGGYEFPPLTLLDAGTPVEKIDKEELMDKKRRIEEKLKEFRIEGEVRECHPGPIITTYEFYPFPGIKVSQVASRDEDLSLALGAESVRIQRIPGKTSLGIEIPNNARETIRLRDILQSDKFISSPSKLSIGLGKTVHDEVYVTDLGIMPHLLIAGATGSGKSVALNVIIASILYKATPEEVKFILIDPKRLEFSLYEGIPHLMAPVITDARKASAVLMDAIRKMEERYHMLHQLKVRNIEQFNQQVKMILRENKGKLAEEEAARLRPLPYIVIIIDELAELMMVGAQDVEYCITRLAQLARAVGIHLIMATQRPSIDVITGTIKGNFSSRIAFRVPSKIDSRIILDASGAEKLLGLGDMLFIPPNFPRVTRMHCAFIANPEVRRLVKFVKEQGIPEYDDKIVSVIKGSGDHFSGELGDKDELYDKAVALILGSGQASVSYLQRRMKLGYARAARIIDQMEQEGILGPSEGSKPREILVDPKVYLKDKELA